MSEKNDRARKIGSGHLEGMARQGLREIRQAFYPESNVAGGQLDYGIYGNSTPGEVAEARKSETRDLNEEPSHSFEERLRAAGERGRDVQGREEREMGRG